MARTIRLTTNDHKGQKVRLYEAQWKHILLGHPDMEGVLDGIERTIQDPDLVVSSDTMARHTDGERRVSCKLGADPSRSSYWLRVPIEYCAAGNWVCTAYVNVFPPDGEVLYVNFASR